LAVCQVGQSAVQQRIFLPKNRIQALWRRVLGGAANLFAIFPI
jgi:hypothetical protein